MKSSFIALAILVMTSMAHAGFPPYIRCSNEGATIKMNGSAVTILVTSHPTDKYETLQASDLNIEDTVIQEFPNEKYGCSSRTMILKSVKLSKKDGTDMPDAYNRLAVKGVLTDYMLCSMNYSWMPAPGQSCL